MDNFTIRELLRNKGESLALEVLTGDETLDRTVSDPDVSSPGLALAGYTERFAGGRMQVLGETEMSYLRSLDPALVEERLTRLLDQDIPAIIVTKGQEVPTILVERASRKGIPVLRTVTATKELYRRIKPFMEAALAPKKTLHGSLADVYGVGLLFVGESGIGKSECVLDLVERGHRLVADDLVIASRRGADLLMGMGHERQGHHMEIRGVGIIDVRALFGIRATRQQKRIEVVVQLEHWKNDARYDRTGLERDETEILGVCIPRITIPLNPGKNITVVSEVVAMNHLLKYGGVDSAAEFDRNLKEAMRPVRDYLVEDYE
ncbi:MAG: HPr(Ser) kinase/phosphatase [Gemmatimonadota bacterium]